MAVAEVMSGLGATVALYDRKPASELTEALESARAFGVEARPETEDIDLANTDLLVTSPGVPISHPAFSEAKRRGIEVISEIELAYRIAKAPIIAITGTNGKTTTTVLTGRMLMADGRETYIAGNVLAGDIKLPLITAAANASPDGVIVAEISTFQLEWISTFRPKIAALLNVTSDHMDRHTSVEEYAGLKARIFENQTPGDFSIVNAENAFTAGLAQHGYASVGSSPRSITVRGHLLSFARLSELGEGAFVRGNDLVVRLNGRETVVCTRSDIQIPGEHNVENVLAASLAAAAFGAKPESIRQAVREFAGVEHRLEPVATVEGVRYINNSMCTNVDAAVRSVEAIEGPQIVIAGGKDKGSDYTALAEAFKRRAKHVVLIGADAGLIESAARKAGYEKTTHAESMQDAVDKARALAEAGDTVVLTPACASFDMFRSFEHRGQVFKDIVKDYAGKAGKH